MSVTCNIGPIKKYYGGPCAICQWEYIFCNPDYEYETVTLPGTPPITLTACFQVCNIYCAGNADCKRNGCYYA